MTSRRKQIKPIKSNNVEFDSAPVEETNETSIQLTKWINEPRVENVESAETREDVNIEDCSSSEEENLNPLNFDIKLNQDAIKIKVPKDDAKIIPIETVDGVDVFVCPMCHKTNISGRENLTVHLQDHQNKNRREDGKHICCLCSKELSSNSSLERHLLTHSNHRPFSCNLCDKKFTTNGNLSRHIKTSHSSNNNNNTSICPPNKPPSSFPSQVAMPPHNNGISAQFNSSIDSSIDEVIKKHNINHNHHHTLSSSTNNLIIETSNSMHSLSNPPTQSSGSILTLSSIGSSPKTHPISSGNINFMPPFLSMNLADLTSILHAQLPPNNSTNNTPNLDFLHATTTTANKDFSFNALFNTNQFSANLNTPPKQTDFKASKVLNTKLVSIKPTAVKKRKQFHRKLTYHLKRKNFHKFSIKSRSQQNLQCPKCSSSIFRTDYFFRHIKHCLPSSTQPLFCPLTICQQRFSSLHKLLRHIKFRHNMAPKSRLVTIKDSDEPLNLSIKTTTPSSHKRTSISHNVNTFLPFLPSFHNKLDITSSTAPATIFPNLLHSSPMSSLFPASANGTPNLQMITSFPVSSQASSSPPNLLTNAILKSLPHCNLTPGLCFSSPCSSSDPPNLTISSSSPSSSSATLNQSVPNLAHSTKKKNSYKDAPKLITCPMEGCAQKFPWNSSLMRHILTHTSHKPFKCTRCTKSFSTKSNRERHMTRVHRVRINRLKFKHNQNQYPQPQHINELTPIDSGIITSSNQPTSLNDTSNLKWAFDPSSKNESSSFQKDKGSIGNHHLDNGAQMPTNGTVELSEEEWILMDSSDRQAEDISTNLLKLAGQPIVEPNPIRLSNGIQVSSAPTNSNNSNSALFSGSRIL